MANFKTEIKVEVKEEVEEDLDLESGPKLTDVTEEEKAVRRKKWRTAKQKMRRERQSEEKKALENEKDKWRKRIRKGHPSVTEEKIKELGERFGQAFSNYCEQFKDNIIICKNVPKTEKTKPKTVARCRWTPDNSEEYKAKKREQERQRRERIMASEEKRKLELEKGLWRNRIKRGHASVTEEKLKELREKFGANFGRDINILTAEQKEQDRKRRAEACRRRNAELKQDQEKYEDFRNRKRFQRLEKQLGMTEEEKEEMRVKKYFYLQEYVAKRGTYSQQPREYKDRRNQLYKQWKARLTPEGKQRWWESVQRAQRKSLAKKIGDDPEKWAGKKMSELQKAYWEKMKQKDPEKWHRLQEKKREYQRNLYHNETEEERKMRRFREKVNGLKRKFRKQLEEEGLDKEEIENRLKLLHEQKWKEFDPEWTWEKYGVGKGKRGKKQNVRSENVNSEMKDDNQERLSELDNPTEKMDPALNHSEEQDFTESTSYPASPSSPATPLPHETALSPVDSWEYTNFPEVPIRLPPTFPCAHCSEVLSTDSDLRNHIRSCHLDKVWMCPKCKEVVLSPQDLTVHFQTVHKAVYSQRNNIPARTTVKVESVQKKYEEKLNFFCMRCPVKVNVPVGFKTRLQLFAHVKLRHRKNFWPCERCNIIKYSKPLLDRHQILCKQKSKT